MILAAWIKPGIGMDLNYIDLNLVINTGVILIFFFYGLKLDWVKMKAGMRNWKMHFAVQLTTFLLFPLLILPFYPLMKNTGYEILWLGMFFLVCTAFNRFIFSSDGFHCKGKYSRRYFQCKHLRDYWHSGYTAMDEPFPHRTADWI